MASKSGGSGLVKTGTAYAAPGAKTVMNGGKSSGNGGAGKPRMGKTNMSRKGSSRGR